MNLSIELRSEQQRTFVGFVKNDAVALYILDKSEESFYFQKAIRCEILNLSFWAKSPFPAEPRHGHVVTYKEEIANWVEGKTVLSGLKFKKIYGSYIHEMTHVLQSGCLGPSYALLYYLPPAPFAAYHYFFDRGPLTDYMTYHSLYNIFEYHAYINAANQSGYEQSMRIWLRIKWGY
ncbi:hypothetical protein ACX8XP_05135 [Calditrichota bacterium LG25]